MSCLLMMGRDFNFRKVAGGSMQCTLEHWARFQFHDMPPYLITQNCRESIV